MGLLDLLYRKQRRIEAMVREYLGAWEECVDRFKEGMDAYVEEGLTEHFFELVDTTHRLESKADDLRRGVEYELYAKALLPESRGDLLELMENLDRVPNRAETILFLIATDRIELPRPLLPGFMRYVSVTDEGIRALLSMAHRVFDRNPDLDATIRMVHDKERACDRIKRELLRTIVAARIESFHKVTLRDLIIEVGELTDISERVADQIMILSLKRRV